MSWLTLAMGSICTAAGESVIGGESVFSSLALITVVVCSSPREACEGSPLPLDCFSLPLDCFSLPLGLHRVKVTGDGGDAGHTSIVSDEE
jgi:hypothetical protein